MRRINKNKAKVPVFLVNADAMADLQDIIRTADPKGIKRSIYARPYSSPDGQRSRLVDALDEFYLFKCAYCERVCKADVEHYRPKAAVNEDDSHPGYYWLGYEWTNLIPSCINCNREGGKHNQFPIMGTRVTFPVIDDQYLPIDRTQDADAHPLSSERPYLIHPEIDNPSNFFEFQKDSIAGIRIYGIDPDGRGDRTIGICLLNRQELRIDREAQVILDFRTSVKSLFSKLNKSQISNSEFKVRLVDLINALGDKSEEDEFTFTLLRKYIVSSEANFNKVVLPYFDLPVQNILVEAYKVSDNVIQ